MSTPTYSFKSLFFFFKIKKYFIISIENYLLKNTFLHVIYNQTLQSQFSELKEKS